MNNKTLIILIGVITTTFILTIELYLINRFLGKYYFQNYVSGGVTAVTGMTGGIIINWFLKKWGG
jgi:hypothetical protein